MPDDSKFSDLRRAAALAAAAAAATATLATGAAVTGTNALSAAIAQVVTDDAGTTVAGSFSS